MCSWIKGKKDLIIVDPWCVFCDYASNAIVKYKTLFSKLFNFVHDTDKCKIILKRQEDVYNFPIKYIGIFKNKFADLKCNTFKKLPDYRGDCKKHKKTDIIGLLDKLKDFL